MVEHKEASQRGIGFQRKRSDRWVEDTVREFQAALVNVPKVALIDDGRLERGLQPDELMASVLDGRHTVAILARRGYTEVPVLLYRGFPTYEARARLFYEHNERRRALRASKRSRGGIRPTRKPLPAYWRPFTPTGSTSPTTSLTT